MLGVGPANVQRPGELRIRAKSLSCHSRNNFHVCGTGELAGPVPNHTRSPSSALLPFSGGGFPY